MSRRPPFATVHAYVADQSGLVLDVLMENRNFMIQTVHVMVEGGCDLMDEEVGHLFDAAILAVEQENPPLQHTATQTSLRNSGDSTGNKAQRMPDSQVPEDVVDNAVEQENPPLQGGAWEHVLDTQSTTSTTGGEHGDRTAWDFPLSSSTSTVTVGGVTWYKSTHTTGETDAT